MKRSGIYIWFVLFFLFVQQGQAQSDLWWNKQQDWNSVTPWECYLILSPAYMGPNALPVPFSEKGIVGDRSYIRFYSDYYHQQGDVTYDGGLKFYVPIIRRIVAIEGWGIVQEHYRMSEALAEQRRARDQHPHGTAFGDAYFATVVSILRNKPLDVALRIGLKTASGGKLRDARYTDSPGYFFDISAGKLWQLSKNHSLRAHIMFGFYCWQLDMSVQRQDDAELFGSGIDYNFNHFSIDASVDGYSGYFGNKPIYIEEKNRTVEFKDRPIVFRLGFSHSFHQWKVGVRYQDGLRDFDYKSIQLRLTYFLPELKKKTKNKNFGPVRL